jgi:Xaa-Pro dipeptidase
LAREARVTDASERSIKEARVREYMAARGLDGVLLTTAANFAWLTGGASNVVGTATEIGAASLLVTEEATLLITDNIERARLEAEELPDAGIETESYPWHAPDLPGVVARRARGGRVAADTAVPGTEPLPSDFAVLRCSLLPAEIERYRWLGEHAALCMTRACFEARPGLSEHRVAGMLGGDLRAFGMTPTLLLAGADERAYRFRHPIPTDRRLASHLLLAVGARRWGLIISMTRLVHFGPLPDELRRKHDAVARVDAALIHATRPGVPVREIFATGCRAYAGAGYPDEWTRHHQGGPTGYAGRDYRATAETDALVQPNQAFAWNPSIAGTKSEDTILAADNGPEIVTATPDLPIVRVRIAGSEIERADILQR